MSKWKEVDIMIFELDNNHCLKLWENSESSLIRHDGS